MAVALRRGRPVRSRPRCRLCRLGHLLLLRVPYGRARPAARRGWARRPRRPLRRRRPPRPFRRAVLARGRLPPRRSVR
eukprot:279681-Chlamydomonas_euryale.AAC.1